MLLDDLDAVRRFAGLLDPDLPFKLALAAILDDRFPGGADFLTLYRCVQQAAWSPTETATGPGHLGSHELRAHLQGPLAPHLPLRDSALPSVRRLDELRGRAWEFLRTGSVGPTDAADPMADWPAHVRAPESIRCSVQALSAVPGEPQLLLNGLAAGHGTGPARPEDGRVHAAVGISSASTVDHVIDHPADSTHHTPDRRIPLTDLTVVLDRRRGVPVLRSVRLDAEVTPLHPGARPVALLPSVLRFLVRGFTVHGSLGRPLWTHALTGADRHPRGVHHLARATLGRITLGRAAWYFPARTLPSPFADGLRELGLPHRFFARTLPGRAWRKGPHRLGRPVAPLYVDVTSPQLLESFARLQRGAAADDVLLLHEALGTVGAEYALDIRSPDLRARTDAAIGAG
ncbi:hypothetical protein [Streptomyces sp. NPDC001404]|uniref:hypothetical protein n=1 Tax=Streptomyces sp. NPDC001404 TaxID=3364571 RepID=UPI0036A1D88E